MEDWKTENWETLCPEGDKAVGEIFEKLLKREIPLLKAFRMLALVTHLFEDVDMCKETTNKFIDHIVDHIGEEEDVVVEAYHKASNETSLAFWTYDYFSHAGDKNAEDYWNEDAKSIYSPDLKPIVTDIYEDVMNNDTLWANTFGDYWKHKMSL